MVGWEAWSFNLTTSPSQGGFETRPYLQQTTQVATLFVGDRIRQIMESLGREFLDTGFRRYDESG